MLSLRCGCENCSLCVRIIDEIKHGGKVVTGKRQERKCWCQFPLSSTLPLGSVPCVWELSKRMMMMMMMNVWAQHLGLENSRSYRQNERKTENSWTRSKRRLDVLKSVCEAFIVKFAKCSLCMSTTNVENLIGKVLNFKVEERKKYDPSGVRKSMAPQRRVSLYFPRRTQRCVNVYHMCSLPREFLAQASFTYSVYLYARFHYSR